MLDKEVKMDHQRRLSDREWVFMQSLKLNGYRYQHRRTNLRLGRGYIIPSTRKEDADTIDFWVKIPKNMVLYPVQVTQVGLRYFFTHHNPSRERLVAFIAQRRLRILKKRFQCKRDGIVFVLLRDVHGTTTSPTVARSDHIALLRALEHHSK